jgi:hypothetical protein
VVELGKVTILGCIHGSIWALDIHKEAWAKKVGVVLLKKLNLIHINALLMKELICNFNYDNQYVKLEKRQINIGEEGIAKMFKLPCGGLMVGA